MAFLETTHIINMISIHMILCFDNKLFTLVPQAQFTGIVAILLLTQSFCSSWKYYENINTIYKERK